jgi:hypothetical protein
VDIEGFSARWQDGGGISSLNDLMLAVSRIGSRCYPKPVERLFAHQFGDAFAIVSNFEEEDIMRCISIAVSLMQYVLSRGGIARCTISEGDWSDIGGLYPREVTEIMHDGKSAMGGGLITIMPVMGSALINAVNTDIRGPRGPLVLLDKILASKISDMENMQSISFSETGWNGFSVDWIKFDAAEFNDIKANSGLSLPDSTALPFLVSSYIKTHGLSGKQWAQIIEKMIALQ